MRRGTTVRFLKDHGDDNGYPLYEKGELASICPRVAIQWIEEGIVEAIHPLGGNKSNENKQG